MAIVTRNDREEKCPFQGSYIKEKSGHEECRCVIPIVLNEGNSWLCTYLNKEEECPAMKLMIEWFVVLKKHGTAM